VTLITNGDSPCEEDKKFLRDHFSPIDFSTSPRLGAIPHTSKLNVFYSIHPSTYDILMFMDCDTVVARDLDGITDPIRQGDADFLCRRGGETDRNRFVDFNSLVRRFCGDVPERKVEFEDSLEWPMFNSGVFLGTSDAVRRIRRNAVDFTYEMYNEWQRTSVLLELPPSIREFLELTYRDTQPLHQIVYQNWTLEQGALALSCIEADVRVRYLEETYNHWGGDEDLHILHCFKSVYQFDRRTMFDRRDCAWIGEYLESDTPGKRILASLVQDYRQTLHESG
jgi:hypothetical protein